MRFDTHGAEQRARALDAATRAGLVDLLAHLPRDRPGVRLHGLAGLRPLLGPTGAVGTIAASVLGGDCRPVRAILFDKTPAANWALGWHQDRTIAVAERIDVPGFANWNVKGGMLHVEPPFGVLAGMATLRVHLDAVPADNAPLLVAPGSHRIGKLPESAVDGVVARCGTATCVADAGDVWLYATPILHASDAAARPARRRVLQVDYGVGDLPGGLRWLGV